MRSFTNLVLKLNDLQTEPEVVEALESYFSNVPPQDGAWALWLLLGNKLKPAVGRRTLQHWIAELSGYPDWLVKESGRHVGNLPETFSLLVGKRSSQPMDIALGSLMEEKIVPLKDWDSYFQKQMLESLWTSMSQDQLNILLQILAGSMRSNCSNFLVIRALANALGVEFPVLLHRLQQEWQPDRDFFNSLNDPDVNHILQQQCPYPIRESGSLQAKLVLIYAYVSGSGEQAGYSAYALAAQNGDELVPVARVPSSLEVEDKDFVDGWIRENTLQKKGPVRTTPAKLVFRIAFDGAYLSKRHKCGLVLDNPVMLNLEKDTSLEQLTPFDELQSYADQQAPLT
ncbi:MAG: hypothetical protein AB3N63_09145 [Puniceicoccaceae bacterium]